LVANHFGVVADNHVPFLVIKYWVGGVAELQRYVFEKVQFYTNGLQKPTSRRENLDFDFALN
jgi:hypothetical protein